MNNGLQVHDALIAIATVSRNLPMLIALPDPDAAEALNQRMQLLDMIDAAHTVSYSQRLVIIAEFTRRSLWRHLIDPEVGEPFPHVTAWLSSGFVGCRRTNMEAKRDAESLADVPTSQLIDVPKASIKVLTGVSTAVRNLPEVLEAARNGEEKLLEKLERDHGDQHLEGRKPLTLRLSRSERKVVDDWVEYAIAEDIAATTTEAIVRACEYAHDQCTKKRD
jgi:hypothetical protein